MRSDGVIESLNITKNSRFGSVSRGKVLKMYALTFQAGEEVLCHGVVTRVTFPSGYDTGVVHRGMELIGITGYITSIDFHNAPHKYGFIYDATRDSFICPMEQTLVYHRLNCNKSTGKYLRYYQVYGGYLHKLCPSGGML